MKTVIIIPAYNEAKVIGSVLQDVLRYYPNVVLVDDASSDGTAEVAEQFSVCVLRHLINRGQGAALKTGIVFALREGADIIVTFDSDGQHRAEEIAKLIEPVALGNFEVALGSRFLNPSEGIPAFRKLVLKSGVIFTRFFSHIQVTDTHNGFRAFSRGAAEKIRILQDRFAHASEILDEIVHHQLRYTEVPVTITYSDYSKGKGQGNLAALKIAFKFLLSKFFR